MLLMSAHDGVNPKIKKEQIRGVKRTIAQINTLLRENE